MRSARTGLVLASLALVLVPLGAMLLAWGYEGWLIASYRERLSTIAAEARAQWRPSSGALHALAGKYGVMLRIVGPDGEVEEIVPGGAGDDSFWVKGLFERVSDAWAKPPVHENLAVAEQGFGPLMSREEVVTALGGAEGFDVHLSASGETAAMVLASPLPDGRVLTVTKASHRGVRRLLALRKEMARLALYQAASAMVVGLLLARWLVHPLKALAQAAARYPGEPLATPELLTRKDELGQLARSMAGLAASLERRRREAVERAADLAHEFKNPLAAIAAAAEHLSTTRELSMEKRQMLSDVSASAAQRLLSTTEALLALARLEAALPQEPRSSVDYREFLERLLDGYRKDVRWEGFELRLTVAAEAGSVSIVPKAWQQLLRNLLDNALVQPSQTRRVEVDVTAGSGAVVTRVKDHGPGVSAGNRDKIFRRFFTDRPPGAPAGTGLGLSIVQAVAEAHGATVELASEVGPGATFVVTLPRAGD